MTCQGWLDIRQRKSSRGISSRQVKALASQDWSQVGQAEDLVCQGWLTISIGWSLGDIVSRY